MNVEETKARLDEVGFCLVQGVVQDDEAERMAERYFELHEQHFDGAQKYQSLQGLMNLDQLCWPWLAYPPMLELARACLGPEIRLAEVCSKSVLPGSESGGVHADAMGMPSPLPRQMWLLNTMWMLTDFTEENGGTHVVPFSHRLASHPTRMAKEHLVPVEGSRGDVLMWHSGLWHGAGTNNSDSPRMGLNFGYIPPWISGEIDSSWVPVDPDVFAQLPPELADLNRHRVGIAEGTERDRLCLGGHQEK